MGGDRNLHAAAGLAAVVDDVFHPDNFAVIAFQELIPVNAEGVASAGIGVVRHIALAGEEVGTAIAIEIDHGHGVGLRPGFIDRVFCPLMIGALLQPKEAVVMRGSRDEIVPAIAIDVVGINEAGAGSEIVFGMPSPLA